MPRTISTAVAEKWIVHGSPPTQLLDHLGDVPVAGRLVGAHAAAAFRVVRGVGDRPLPPSLDPTFASTTVAVRSDQRRA